jgi:hypothetical protein
MRVVRHRTAGLLIVMMMVMRREDDVAVAPVAVFGGEGIRTRSRVIDPVPVDGFRSFDFVYFVR